ncbi:MAG: hypothetical protein HS132_01285 [Planctomycetia bacterium]|nr:hypothetical protein [Planctomycetia bacterium]
MDKESLLRLVDSLHRDKEIAKDVVFQGIEAALTTAARKHFKSQEMVSIQIDRNTGRFWPKKVILPLILLSWGELRHRRQNKLSSKRYARLSET